MRHRTVLIAALVVAATVAVLAGRGCSSGVGRAPGTDPAPVASPSDSRADSPESAAPQRTPRIRAAPPESDDATRAAAQASDASGGREPRVARPADRRPATVPPRDDAPADAALLVASSGLRGWTAIEGAPRGLASERGAIPGRLQVHLSAAAERALVFRVASEPTGAVRLPRDGLLRVESGRDFGMIQVAGLLSGPVVIVLTPVEGADPGALPLCAAIDVRAMDEFPEPILFAVLATDDAHRGAGATAGGDRQIRALRGTDAGAIRVLRSGFRGFASESTDVLVGVEDPAQILGPVAPLLTIPAGATEPREPLRIVLRDAEGKAVLRFRAGTQQVEFRIESVSAQWTAPATVVVPVGARIDVPLRLEPGTRGPPLLRAETRDAAIVAASVRPRPNAPFAERFVVVVRGVAAGVTRLQVTADQRPDLEIGATAVAAEIVLRDGRPVVVAPAAGLSGDIVLTVAAPAKFAGDGAQSGACFDVRGAGTPEIVVRLHDVAAGTARIEIPVRLEGRPAAMRVTDRRHEPERLPYEIDAHGTDR